MTRGASAVALLVAFASNACTDRAVLFESDSAISSRNDERMLQTSPHRTGRRLTGCYADTLVIVSKEK